MTTAKHFNFPTKSSFGGSWDKARNCMHGFGYYKYPDRSVYHGYFTSGKFHGYASLKLAEPFDFTIKGYFHDGKLAKIENMYFEDGLRVKAKIKNKHELDFSEWVYCTDKDRRFPAEILNGLRAVGPNSMITASANTRELDVGEFDTEQGVYHVKSGFINKRLPPYPPASFLPCPEEVNWILSNCREGYEPDERREPAKEVCRDTLEAHIDNQILTDMRFSKTCESMQQKPGYKYFAKLYALEMAEAKKTLGKAARRSAKAEEATTTEGACVCPTDEPDSCSSFSFKKFKEPELEGLVCYRRRASQFRRSDESLSVNMSLLNAKQNIFN